MMQFRELPGTHGTLRAIGFIAGGPILNVLAAFVMLPLAIYGTALGNLCGVFLGMSLLLAAVSMLPHRIGMNTSDGSKLFSLLFNRAKRDEILFSLSIGVRLEEIVDLCRARQFEEGLKKTDSLLQRAALIRLFPADSEFQQRLRRLKASLERELAAPVGIESDMAH